MSAYLEMKDINKSFIEGIPVLKNMNLGIERGEIHALVGENGSGKSTTMKILFGDYQADSGAIYIEGKSIDIHRPADAYEAGIRMIHQEMNLVPEFTVGQNILLGNENVRLSFFLDRTAMYRKVQALIDSYGLEIDARQKIRELSVAQRQMVEILRSLYFHSTIVVMDEPTSALTEREANVLFEATRKLRENGTSVIYITHRLEELPGFADRITVIRDGVNIVTEKTEDISRDEIVRCMVGRTIKQFFIKTTEPSPQPIFEVKNLSRRGEITDVGFTLRKSEILGVAGLMGSRRTEIAETIYGLLPKDTGTVSLNGEILKIRRCRDAIMAGVGYLPEDRKTEGLVLGEPVYKNVTYPKLGDYQRFFMINEKKRKTMVKQVLDRIQFKAHYYSAPVRNLSGGNQQKVIMGRWLSSGCEVLILNEPTRGVDVGAKKDIYAMINEFVGSGKSILLISSDMPELLNMSDRVIVVSDGRIIESFEGDLISKQEKILTAMLGGTQ